MSVRPTPVDPLKRQYPHVDDITDWRAQQSVRLLWDRVFNLEERLQAATATQGDLVEASNSQEDQLAQLRLVAGEALAIAQRAAGEAGEGGETSNEFGKIGKGSAPPTVALPDLSGDVDAYAAAHAADLANSCLSAGGDRDYIDGLVAYLQAIDPRVGGNGKRGDMGDPSEDAISYYHGAGSPTAGSNDVYVVDVISNHCPVTGSAGPAWQDVTTSKAYGAWRPDALP